MIPHDPYTLARQRRREERLVGLSSGKDSSDLPVQQVHPPAQSLPFVRPPTRPIETGLGVFGFFPGGF